MLVSSLTWHRISFQLLDSSAMDWLLERQDAIEHHRDVRAVLFVHSATSSRDWPCFLIAS